MAAVVAPSLHTSTSGRYELASKSMAVPYDDHVDGALAKHEYNFVMCDPALRDMPIVYASEGFCRMTGYARDEIIGRNCRFLHGPDTDRRIVMEMRDAIREEHSCQVKILNYTKSGRPFWNLLHLSPIYSSKTGRVIHYLGVQTPLSPPEGDAALPTPTPSAQGAEAAGDGPCRSRSAGGAQEAAEKLPSESAEGHGRCLDGEATAERQVAMPGGGPGAGGNAPVAGGRAAEVGGRPAERLRGGDGGEPALEDADLAVADVDRGRAARAVRGLLADLARASAGQVSAERCTAIADGAAKGVLCTSMLTPLVRIQQSFVLVDPALPDSPIVHASDVFLQMTGYACEEVVGRNCRFLQGPNTDADAVAELRDTVRAERACTVRLLNYRKDGTSFWNSLHIAPVRKCDGKVAFFCGVQLDVTPADVGEQGDAQLRGRLKHMATVGAVRVAVRSLHGHGLRRTLAPATA
uniref:Putative LOV domain-containing protein n=1 Tax=Serritaenia braunii TaxID=592041 RepID=A0A126X3F0_9VIRI|nr:putative LOV domain-containing protein [Mesotaenium braunii]